MNGKDKQDLNVILQRMDQADEDRGKIHEDIIYYKYKSGFPHHGTGNWVLF